MQNWSRPMNRAAFLQESAALFAGFALTRRISSTDPSPLEHPEPRPGITSERVLSADDLGTSKKSVLAAYDAARTYPGVFDGLACACGCAGERDGLHRSLLVCYETKQPTGCHACQMEAEFVAKLAKEDKSLADIRAAVDKKFK